MRRLLPLLVPLLALAGGPAFLGGPSLPAVEVSGCEAWLAGKVCSFGASPLRIWVPGVAAATPSVDGRDVAAVTERIAGGLLYRIEVKPGARRLSLAAPDGGSFELQLAPSLRPGWYEDVKKDVEHSKLAPAEAKLAALRGLSPNDNAFKLSTTARIKAFRSRRSEAAKLAVKAADLWRDNHSAAVRDLTFAAQQLHLEGDFAQRDEILRQARQIAGTLRSADLIPFLPAYYLAMLDANVAVSRGDLRGALARIEELDLFDRHGLFESWEQHAWLQEQRALALIELGRFEDAAETLDRLLAEPAIGEKERAATRAEIQMNRGWAAYLAREAGRPGADPQPFFEAAWRFHRDGEDDEKRFNCKLNLAAAALQSGQPQEAARLLEEASAFQAAASVNDRFHARDLEARLLLRLGKKAEALQLFLDLDRDASALRAPTLRWLALFGRAEALRALGREGQALDVLDLAARLVDGELLLIPASKGRETFLARRDQATRMELELLLARGEDSRAWDKLWWRMTQTQRLLRNDEILAGFDPRQRARRDLLLARYRESLAAEDRDRNESRPGAAVQQKTRLADRHAELDQIRDSLLDQLGSAEANVPVEVVPRPGELMLGFFPLENGWIGLARSAASLEVARLDGRSPRLSPVEVAKGLLALFRKQIAAAERIKILPWGELDTVDFHLLEGSKPLVYGVAAGRGRAPFEGGPKRALLIEDPAKSLSSAAAEIELVETILRERRPGMELVVPLTEDATPAAVSRELAKTDFLHFAGHSAADGYGGFESKIALRRGELRPSDFFALERVPSQVVLSSCEAGYDRDRPSGEKGLGLAQALVLAGADQVLAATRAVDDAKTARLMEEIYRRWPAGGREVDLAVLLFEARAHLRQNEPDPTWDSFRVFEP